MVDGRRSTVRTHQSTRPDSLPDSVQLELNGIQNPKAFVSSAQVCMNNFIDILRSVVSNAILHAVQRRRLFLHGGQKVVDDGRQTAAAFASRESTSSPIPTTCSSPASATVYASRGSLAWCVRWMQTGLGIYRTCRRPTVTNETTSALARSLCQIDAPVQSATSRIGR